MGSIRGEAAAFVSIMRPAWTSAVWPGFSPDASMQSALTAQEIVDQTDVQFVFVASNGCLTPLDSFELEHGHLVVMKLHEDYVLVFSRETTQPGHLINEIHRRSVFEVHNGIGRHCRSQLGREVQYPDILTTGQVDPQVHIQGRCHDPLGDGSRHSDQCVTDAFRFKGFQ